MNLNKKIAIIIVNWKQYELTINCLLSLKKLEYKNWKVILVDNESNFEKINKIKSDFNKVEVIESEFDNETGNIAFRASFPNDSKLLKNGQTGKVLMTVPVNNTLISFIEEIRDDPPSA